jgi:hypothetical protein
MDAAKQLMDQDAHAAATIAIHQYTLFGRKGCLHGVPNGAADETRIAFAEDAALQTLVAREQLQIGGLEETVVHACSGVE